MARLPSLTPAAAELLAGFEERALSQQWADNLRYTAVRAMRVLLSWLGADAPILEADVRALGDARLRVTVRRLLSFPADQGLRRLQTVAWTPAAGDHAEASRVARPDGR
jgi:hypothetical protein